MIIRAGRRATSAVHLVDVPIDCIHLPDSAGAVKPPAHRALVVESSAEQIVNLLRPPLLVPDEGQPGHYLIVGNEPTFLRQLQLAGTDANGPRTVLAIVLTSLGARSAAIAPPVERYLVPLMFGELSVRKAATARRKLREAGIAPPHPIRTRAAVRRLVKLPATTDDA